MAKNKSLVVCVLDEPNTCYKFSNRAGKNINVEEVTSDHKDGKVDLHHPAQTKDKIDRQKILFLKEEKIRERERPLPT